MGLSMDERHKTRLTYRYLYVYNESARADGFSFLTAAHAASSIQCQAIRVCVSVIQALYTNGKNFEIVLSERKPKCSILKGIPHFARGSRSRKRDMHRVAPITSAGVSSYYSLISCTLYALHFFSPYPFSYSNTYFFILVASN